MTIVSPLNDAATTQPVDDLDELLAVPLLDVTVVLPCFNEEESVGACVAEALTAIHARGWTGEVVVVDNNSTDRSAIVARAAGARVVEEPVPGYGAALLRGIRNAHALVVVMADADCTYPLDRLGELVAPVLTGDAEIMIGSRLDAATRHSMPWLHRFVGTPVLTWLVREAVGGGQGLSDSQSGFRAFAPSIIDRLGLVSTGMEFASEMLVRAAQQGLRVAETPLGYRPRVGESKLSTWRDGLRHLRLILRLSPHLLLWWPGIAAMVTAVAMYIADLFEPTGVAIGSLTWQPIYLAGGLLVLGLLSALCGALLARYSATSSRRTRRGFQWVSETHFIRSSRGVGIALIALAAALDALLLAASVTHSTIDISAKLSVAGLAQGLFLAGAVLAVFAGLARVLAQQVKLSPDVDRA